MRTIAQDYLDTAALRKVTLDEIEAAVGDMSLEQLDLTIDGDWACLAARVSATG